MIAVVVIVVVLVYYYSYYCCYYYFRFLFKCPIFPQLFQVRRILQGKTFGTAVVVVAFCRPNALPISSTNSEKILRYLFKLIALLFTT